FFAWNIKLKPFSLFLNRQCVLFPFALLINDFINLLFANKLITNYSERTIILNSIFPEQPDAKN
ncbi:MAG: hypothetical protein E7L08_14270, partial [Klebsiella michiganensis]|uniref:hypothetical protein n=1 Tax=Klebsiella michiganensis TaxID=1134687 RepID=UPI001F31C7AD